MKKLFVRFHIGRGGRFNNQGHLSFVNEDNFQDLISACMNDANLFEVNSVYDEETDTEKDLPEEEWYLYDASNKILVQGKDAMNADTGCLDWDGEYDTDYVKTTDELNDKEIECLWEEYCKDAWMSDELKDAICSLKYKKRVHDIRTYPANWECFHQYGSETVHIDGNIGEFNEEEWREMLKMQDFCPRSVDMIIDELYMHDIIADN